MDVQLSSANKTYIEKSTLNTNKPNNQSINPGQNKESEGKLKKAITILGVLGAASIGIAAVVKNKKVNSLTSNVPEVKKVITQLKDIKFDKGVANLPDGTKFTGKIEDTLKSGDKILLEYTDGILKKSVKSGIETIEKVYEKNSIGQDVVKITIGDKTEVKNLSETIYQAKNEQAKLNSILNNNDCVSGDEFKKQTDGIKFKNKKQKEQIEEIYDSKKNIEKLEQEKADRLAKEEADRLAKKEAERLAKEEADRLAEAKKIELEEFSKLIQKQDVDLDVLTKQCVDMQTQLLDAAREKFTKKYPDLNFDSLKLADKWEYLDAEQVTQYNLCMEKIGLIYKQKSLNKTKLLNSVMYRESDKAVKVPDISKYCDNDELSAFGSYYDASYCNIQMRKTAQFEDDSTRIMDKVFKKAPELNEEAVVYRGISSESYIEDAKRYCDSIKEGQIFKNAGYTSTSTNFNDAQFKQFAQSALEGNGVLMRIKLPKGSKGVLGGYNEYLLPRNSEIKVNKLSVINNVKVADCEYILP